MHLDATPTGKDAGQTMTASRKRQLQDHLKIHKIKRCKISTIQLAEDLLCEIFVRLPVKSLIRFRCVSKGMCRMIDSPFFAKNHNNHRCVSQRSLSDDYAIILKQSSRLFSVNFSKDNLNRANAIKLDFTFPNKSMFLIGCCNGIFCLKMRKAESYVLWNPSNGTFQKVEYPNLPRKSNITNDSIGYDHVNDDYKIFRVRDDTSLEVYSFRKHSWRIFNGTLPSDLFTIREGVCVSGAMHWLSSNPRFIAAFDFMTETFRSIPLPREATQLEQTPYHLNDFRGCLCVALCPSGDVAAYTVWVMEKYGVERSWTKIDNINSIPFYYFPNRERRLLCNSGWLTWWDPLDHSYERIRFPGSTSDQPRYCLAHIYVNTQSWEIECFRFQFIRFIQKTIKRYIRFVRFTQRRKLP